MAETPSNGQSFTVKEVVLRLEGKVDALVESVAAMKADSATVQDHEKRIRSLESWRYALPASALTAMVAIGLAVSQILH